MENRVAKSVATTNLVNALAEHYKIELHETSVASKYIGELIQQDKIAIGGAESAGFPLRYHVPEKDGVLAGFISRQIAERAGSLFAKVGSFYSLPLDGRGEGEVHYKVAGRIPRLRRKESSQGCVHGWVEAGVRRGSWGCYRVNRSGCSRYNKARSESDPRS